MTLSDDRQSLFQERFFEFERELVVPLISPTEKSWLNEGFQMGVQMGREIGLQMGIERAIELGLGRRFGEAGLKLLPSVQTIRDSVQLKQVLGALWNANTLDEIEPLLPPISVIK